MLKLDENFIVKADGNNVMLVEKTSVVADKTAKKRIEGQTYNTESIVGYYINVSRAVVAYIDLKLSRKIEVEDITTKELIEEIAKLKQSVLNLNN